MNTCDLAVKMRFKIKHMKCKLEQGQTLMTGIFFVTKLG